MKTRCSNFVLAITAALAVGIPPSLRAAAWYQDGTTVSTTTELTISPAIPVQTIGSPVTLTAKTSGVQKSGVTISFYVDGTLIGTALTDASSQASFPFATPLLTEGQHTFRADFPRTVTATRLLGTHVRIYVNDVFVGYYDLYECDLAAASSGELTQQFLDTRPPLIFSQPTNQIVRVGSDVRVTTDVRGQSPLSYQWLVGGEPLAGATDATLALTGVQTNQAGIYTVMASNSLGTITSSNASLTVFMVSSSLSPSENATVDEGSAVTFGVDAFSALPLTFQWCHNSTNLPSATAARLSLTNVQPADAGVYSVEIGDGIVSVSADVGTFAVSRRPVINTQPTNQIVAVGSNVDFNADIVGGAPLSIQWRVGGEPLSGETNATLTLAGVQTTQAGIYSVVASNALGTITSSNASLTVFMVSSSLSPPDNATVDEGSAVTFSVDAFSALPLTFQWRRYGTNLPSATAARLSLTNVQPTDAGIYTVEIGDGFVSMLAPVATVAVQPKGVSISSSIWLADRGFQFAFEGRAWFNHHVIAVSTNLLDWSVLTNVFSVGGILSVVDSEAARYPQRFYRLESSLVVQPIPNMVWINPGTFTMGSPTNEVDRGAYEGPQTAVTISRGFWLGKYEVTQGEYRAVMGNNPSYFTGDPTENPPPPPPDNQPVEQVSWNDATNYCAKLTERERTAGRLPGGYVYRLPTEAEWEYAARAGTSTRFSYGDDPNYPELANYAWYRDNSRSQTHPVGQKRANAWGLYDMAGNVEEWCQDWRAYEYPGGIAVDPQGPATGVYRVLRGGYWYSGARDCRSAYRHCNSPDVRYRMNGFRVVLAPGQP